MTRLTSPKELGEGGNLDWAWQRVWKEEPRGVFGKPEAKPLGWPTLMESILDLLPSLRGSGGSVALRIGLSRFRLSFGGRRELLFP